MAEGTRSRVNALHPAFVADKEAVKEHARTWSQALKAHWNAAIAFPMEGVDAAISAWIEDQCNEALSRELRADEARAHGALIRAANERELGARRRVEVSETARRGKPSKAIAETRLVLTKKMVHGKRDVKTC